MKGISACDIFLSVKQVGRGTMSIRFPGRDEPGCSPPGTERGYGEWPKEMGCKKKKAPYPFQSSNRLVPVAMVVRMMPP